MAATSPACSRSNAPGTVRVRLHRPPPLGAPLQVAHREGGRLELLHDTRVVASAEPAQLELSAPAPPDYVEALEASRHYTGFVAHAFPGCFVCGPERARGDGLRIFAGPLAGVAANAGAGAGAGADAGTGADVGKGAARPAAIVAAPWVPDVGARARRSQGAARVHVAALDCPGYFAARADSVPMLLGEFTAHVDRRVHVDEPCVIVGWRIRVEGRKYEVGTALFDEDGELCAKARALWIEPRP